MSAEPSKVLKDEASAAYFVPLSAGGCELRIPERAVLEAVRDLGLFMGEYASPGNYVHSVSVFLAALEKEGFCLALSSLPEGRPEENCSGDEVGAE